MPCVIVHAVSNFVACSLFSFLLFHFFKIYYVDILASIVVSHNLVLTRRNIGEGRNSTLLSYAMVIKC